MTYGNLTLFVAGDGLGITVMRGVDKINPGDIVRSEHAHECVTLDFDKDDKLISVEVIAPPKVERATT